MAANRTPITGASDHLVSAAIYLDDPEGNGVEVYVDRPTEQWRWQDKLIAMTTDQLDFDDLVARSKCHRLCRRTGWLAHRPRPLARRRRCHGGKILSRRHRTRSTRRRHGATFMSSGGYHHHVAGNVWHSAGAGRRDEIARGSPGSRSKATTSQRSPAVCKLPDSRLPRATRGLKPPTRGARAPGSFRSVAPRSLGLLTPAA